MIFKSKDPFTKWFLRALQHDSELILNNPLYRDYQRLLTSGGELKNIEIKRIHKKAQLINRWLSKIDANSPEDFQTELRPSLIEALSNIEQSYFLLAKSIRFETLPAAINKASDLRFFELKEVSEPSAPPVIDKKAKTVEDILNPIIGDEPPVKLIPKPKLPTPSKENWLEDEEAPESLKNLPKATNDANWLEDF